jgi:molybdopterin converting factor subunit 1
MTVQVLFFALAREHAGCNSESLELETGARVADALVALRSRHPALEPMWTHLAVAVDGQLVGHDAPLRAGSELALLPPVSGG